MTQRIVDNKQHLRGFVHANVEMSGAVTFIRGGDYALR